jgi:hypothetical protein
MSAESNVLEKCQAKLKLAASLDREATGHGEKRKDCQKRADALRAEVERLIVDPSQTEMPLAGETEPGDEEENEEAGLDLSPPEPIGVTEP